MSHNGKIARLPHAIRNQLNLRLQDGEPGAKLVQWLNGLPEVQIVLQAEFDGRPIREQNISEWKKRGFREWQIQQDALEQLPQVVTEAAELNGQVNGKLTDHLAVWLTAHLMAAVRRLAAADLPDAARWKLLHEACADLVALRRGDQNSEGLSIERERLSYLKEDLLSRHKRRFLVAMEAMTNFVNQNHPQAQSAWDTFCTEVWKVRGPMDGREGPHADFGDKVSSTTSRSESIRPNPSQSDLIRVNPT